jgi:hypothetical protein
MAAHRPSPQHEQLPSDLAGGLSSSATRRSVSGM